MDKSLQQRIQALGKMVSGEQQVDDVTNYWKENFDLHGNPFPPSGIADAGEENPPLRDEVTEQILTFIDRTYRTGLTESLILSGDYGAGKTHTLRFIENLVNTNMGTGDHAARAIYVERPRLEAHELNRTILRTLGHDTVRKYIWFAIRGIIAEEIETNAESFQSLRDLLTTPTPSTRKLSPPMLFAQQPAVMTASFADVFNPENLVDHRRFLLAFEQKGWDRESLRAYLIRCLITAVGGDCSTELAGAFVALLLSRDEASFSSWETLTGVLRSKSLSSLRAPEFLEFLVAILQLNGIIYLYILLDEFEEVPQGYLLTARQRQEYLYTMREVFDRLRKGVAVVMGITPPALAPLYELAPPFADRNPTQINLDAISIEDALRLVASHLNKGKIDNIGDDGVSDDELDSTEEVNELKPLSRELLLYILDHFPENAQRTPRSLIQFLHRLFEYMANHRLPSIDTNILDQILIPFAASKPSEGNTLKKRRI